MFHVNSCSVCTSSLLLFCIIVFVVVFSIYNLFLWLSCEVLKYHFSFAASYFAAPFHHPTFFCFLIFGRISLWVCLYIYESLFRWIYVVFALALSAVFLFRTLLLIFRFVVKTVYLISLSFQSSVAGFTFTISVDCDLRKYQHLYFKI